MGPTGVVTAAHPAAAAAGTQLLAAGGTAVDAAIATAFGLCVTEPMNCGLGGYGGAAVIRAAGESLPAQVDFVTAAPGALADEMLATGPRVGSFVHGGLAVTRPAVVPGLWALHQRFGRRSWAEVIAPALALARDGFRVGPDLLRALRWARCKTLFVAEFWELYAPEGHLPAELKFPKLAETLEEIAANGGAGLAGGRLAAAIARAVQKAGGVLSEADLAAHDVRAQPAHKVGYAGAEIFGPTPELNGFGVLASAFGAAGPGPWSGTRDTSYVERAAVSLRAAWRERGARVRGVVTNPAAVQHTTHLCAADAEGGIASLTFTHGPLWFGSGVVVPDTGILLNCGANLLVRDVTNGRRFAQTNLSPVLARAADGRWFAVGTPGGRRIPATVMTALVDVLTTGTSLAEAIARPRLSVGIEGRLEVEPALLPQHPGACTISPAEYYGPASGIALDCEGSLVAAQDPRFSGAIATAEANGKVVVA